jgi:hypothetical protein
MFLKCETNPQTRIGFTNLKLVLQSYYQFSYQTGIMIPKTWKQLCKSRVPFKKPVSGFAKPGIWFVNPRNNFVKPLLLFQKPGNGFAKPGLRSVKP